MKVVLTRERGHNERLRSWLPEGCEVAEIPVTETDYFDEAAVLEDVRSSDSFGAFATLVVTSARSARYVGSIARSLVEDADCFTVGATTSDAVATAGVRVSAQSAGAALDLAGQVTRPPVLVLGAARMRDELAEALRSRGLAVTVVPCYETRRLTLSDDQRTELTGADVVFVGAPSAWSVLADAVPRTTWVVVPGRTTAEAVGATHGRVVQGWGPSLRERLVEPTNDPER